MVVAWAWWKPPFDYTWDLSPDGSQIAMLFPVGENRIRLLPLRGGAPHDVVVNGWYGFSAGLSPTWDPDGKGFYVGSSSPRGALITIEPGKRGGKTSSTILPRA